MKYLKEIRLNGNNIQLKDNLVKSSILPEKVSELTRTITIEGNTVVEGPIFAHKLEIQNGDLEIKGAVFTQLELYINSEAKGNIDFAKSVGSADSIVSRAANCKIIFHSDVNAKSITLYNAFVAGSIYADEITLENCVVIGGVFATQTIDITNSVVGTFNSPFVSIAQTINILLPSAFSVEKIVTAPNTKLYNLSLADLGSLFKGLPQQSDSGKIEINTEVDEVKTYLSNEQTQKTLHIYTVIGKILAADLIDTDKFQNHFLLTSAALSSQLLKTYDFGIDKNGEPISITFEKIYDFFFDILLGKIEIQTINGKFNISQITGVTPHLNNVVNQAENSIQQEEEEKNIDIEEPIQTAIEDILTSSIEDKGIKDEDNKDKNKEEPMQTTTGNAPISSIEEEKEIQDEVNEDTHIEGPIQTAIEDISTSLIEEGKEIQEEDSEDNSVEEPIKTTTENIQTSQIEEGKEIQEEDSEDNTIEEPIQTTTEDTPTSSIEEKVQEEDSKDNSIEEPIQSKIEDRSTSPIAEEEAKQDEQPIIEPNVIIQENKGITIEDEKESKKDQKQEDLTQKPQQLTKDELYQEGLKYYNNKNYKQAIQLYLQAIEKGSVSAMCEIANCLFNGEGIAQDKDQAIYWWQKAAEANDSFAQYNLGVCYELGDGVVKKET
jgi:tetratricopeptide (TPR) repeat protein